MPSKLAKRVLFGSVMIVALAGLLYLDWWLEDALDLGPRGIVKRFEATGEWAAFGSPLYCLPTTAVLLAILITGYLEFDKLARASGIRLLSVSGLIAVALISTSPYLHHLFPRYSGVDPSMLLIFALMGICGEQFVRYRTRDALRQVAATVLAVVYLGVAGSFILSIRTLGVAHLVIFLAAVKFTDIGAYFTGMAVGRHKMIPWLSPGKTWEGLFGGLVAAAVVSAVLARSLGALSPEIAWRHALVFGVVMGVAGQFGDLCESLLKRSANVKDSGAVVPEFGGVLDLIDSPLLAAPVAMLLMRTSWLWTT